MKILSPLFLLLALSALASASAAVSGSADSRREAVGLSKCIAAAKFQRESVSPSSEFYWKMTRDSRYWSAKLEVIMPDDEKRNRRLLSGKKSVSKKMPARGFGRLAYLGEIISKCHAEYGPSEDGVAEEYENSTTD